ncbi:TetR family transcriptional regulator C-terminal domain-containing protein [Arcicella aquatica]|uniref:TetR family transcriptional regulator C-terminal domain-containing protein n=1 Tax=Arcicella aquatica TaxID=217141 RepID=A0ABU5QJR7_9BACT|nr:TetR family transcriptional regulator C-terminal domain-containing protein [Arcicella aquatica]MEA5257288.1 TetR family transcriptional regulator C-terminal domain-containing protein [Arcicella aquatica]
MDKTEKIKQAYIEYFLENGNQPPSVFAFTKKLKMKESDFYEYYNSFELLESDIWLGFFKETKAKIEAEEIYATYSVREKLLAFYYTWVEVLKQHRSYTTETWRQIDKRRLKTPAFMVDLKVAFKDFTRDLIFEGKESNEVQPRKFIDERYPDAFWLQFLMVLNFWVKDKTKDFQQTDAMIEKSVNTSFDLMASSALDSVIDFAKFMFQNR